MRTVPRLRLDGSSVHPVMKPAVALAFCSCLGVAVEDGPEASNCVKLLLRLAPSRRCAGTEEIQLPRGVLMFPVPYRLPRRRRRKLFVWLYSLRKREFEGSRACGFGRHLC